MKNFTQNFVFVFLRAISLNQMHLTLVLTGAEAHICVTQTALHALPEYNVHIVADAIASRVPENKQIALQRMARQGAVITSAEMFIYEVLQKAGTDEFKAVLPLVK